MSLTIVAMGGGGFSQNDKVSPLDLFLLDQAHLDRPRVCFVPTASGDADGYISKFYDCFAGIDCIPDHLPLFRRTAGDLAEFVASQDVFYVGGGNTANMLAIWRLHGLPELLRAEAGRRRLVVGGLSAGGLCWFESGSSDSFGPLFQPLSNALGWIAGSFCPHYDAEATRRPLFQSMVGSGQLPDGIACDNGAAACFENGQLAEYVSEVQPAGVFSVVKTPSGVTETSLPTRFLAC